MAVDDLWRLKDGTPSKRDGRGLRYRVRVPGWPTTRCRTKAEAERLNAQRITDGPPRERSSTTVGELVDRWLATKTGREPKTIESAEASAARVRPQWGSVAAADVTSPDVEEWIANLRVPAPGGRRGANPAMKLASNATKAKTLQCLSGALAIAVKTGTLEKNPAAGIRVGAQGKRDVVFLEPPQIRAMAEAAGRVKPGGATLAAQKAAQDNPAMIWWMATTGTRIGETCALTVGDVNANRARARIVKAKNHKARDVPIPAFVLAMLRLDGRAPGEPLFPAAGGGHRRPDLWRKRVFAPAAEAVGRPGLTPHALRHTAASWMIAAGADIKTVQEVLGHGSARLTLDLYGHLWARRIDEVAQKVGALVVGELGTAS